MSRMRDKPSASVADVQEGMFRILKTFFVNMLMPAIAILPEGTRTRRHNLMSDNLPNQSFMTRPWEKNFGSESS